MADFKTLARDSNLKKTILKALSDEYSRTIMNYTIEQYARDVVHAIGSICTEENISHPMIISESGRAVVAHHSILVTEVIDVSPAFNG